MVREKAKITADNIKGFVQGWTRSLLDKVGFLDDCTKEQWLYRIGIMDEQCLINRECPCECSVPEKQLDSRVCDNQCYGPMLSCNQWNKYKEIVDITHIIEKAYSRIEQYKLEI